MTIPWQEAYGAALHLVEREWLKRTATTISQRFEHSTIVNLGVFQCASMYCLRAGALKARIIGIDITPSPLPIHEELRAEFIIANSQVCHVNFKDPIHLLFIDGDHDYKAVLGDIAGWVPKVVPGGIVAFHDYAPSPKQLKKWKLQGVRQAIDEWNAKANWKKLSSPGSLAAFQRVE